MNGTASFAAKNYWLFPKILSALGIESSWESQSYSKKFFTELYRNVACKFPNFVHLKMKIKLKWISRVKCDEFIPKWNRIKLKCIYILFYFILLAQLLGEPPLNPVKTSLFMWRVKIKQAFSRNTPFHYENIAKKLTSSEQAAKRAVKNSKQNSVLFK